MSSAERPSTVPDGARPRLPRGVRLTFDARRDAWMLLAPETIFTANGPAAEILRLCDGTRSVDQIVDAMCRRFAAGRTQVARDVTALLARLREQRVLDL